MKYIEGELVNYIKTETKAEIIKYENDEVYIHLMDKNGNYHRKENGCPKVFKVKESELRKRNNFDKLGFKRVYSF